MKNLKVDVVVTHAGTFHADDVFATALVKYFINSDVEVMRVPHQANIDEIKAEIEVEGKLVWFIDVGRRFDPEKGFFDHHHEKSEVAAAGRVYNFLKEKGYISPRAAKVLDILVTAIDLNDVGIKKSEVGEFSWVISQYNSDDIYDSDFQNFAFRKATEVTMNVIDGVVREAAKKDAAIETLRKGELFKLNENDEFGVVEVPKYIPFEEVIHEITELDGADLVIWYDEVQNKWKAQTVPDAPGSFGKRGRSIKVSQELPEGVDFVHIGEFFMVASNRDVLISYLKENFK